MSETDIPRMCGTCSLKQTEPVVAGSYGTWELTYTAGEWGIDDGGTLAVMRRFASDWGEPQMSDPEGDNYLTVVSDGQASLRPRFDTKAHVRPWRKGIVIDVYDDGLLPGETVRITYGDRSGGSRGSRAQTFCERTFEFRVLVNAIATGEFTKLEDCPEIEVLPGPAQSIVAIAPSQCNVGDECRVAIKFEDGWGNPTEQYSGTVLLQAEGPGAVADEVEWLPDETGLMDVPLVCNERGIVRVRATAGEMKCLSNPVECEDRYLLKRYFGDPHGQSEGTVGTNTVGEYFDFARDRARVDFCSHQGNDFQITKEQWAEIQEEVRSHYEPGRFVTLLGYEWSGNAAGGGDHNVWYLDADAPIFRSSHALIGDRSDLQTDRFPVEALYEELHGHSAVVAAHVGGRRATLSRHDGDVKRLVEVYSAWGEFEWMLTQSLELGHSVGVTATSDGHKGRPGASYPGAGQFGVYGGLTCVYASELTRERVFEALRDRRCYGTSGERIIVRYSAGEHFMGVESASSELTASVFNVMVAGTGPIESVELLRGSEIVAAHDGFASLPPSNRVRIAWSGARILGRDRATCWDGSVTVKGARVLGAMPYAFDSPAEGLTQVTDRSVSWTSITTGDEDGVVLELDDVEAATLTFEAGPCSFEVGGYDLAGLMPYTVDCGGVAQQVTVRRLPADDPPMDVRCEWPGGGVGFASGAYWVRVKQMDGARAWTSPIFFR